MTERPIIFSGAMVRAILDGHKTQTRRVVKLPDGDVRNVRYWAPPSGRSQEGWADPGVNYHSYGDHGKLIGNHIDPCPYGQPGDRLWVRETMILNWARTPKEHAVATYAADGAVVESVEAWPWKRNTLASRHMPRRASRLLLEVKAVRVERLQDITNEDAIAEGARRFDNIPLGDLDKRFSQSAGRWSMESPKSTGQCLGAPEYAFANLWQKLNSKRGYDWYTNPWVWVIEFERVRGEQSHVDD